MRIGLLTDLQLPRPWTDADQHALLRHELERIVLADELGFASAWVQEHHFLEELGHGGGASLLLAAAAARTAAIRLGLAVLSVDPAVRHPAVLAGELATLDQLSDGRLDVATGVARSGAEVAGLGLTRQTARARWQQHTSILARLLGEAPFAGTGEDAPAPAVPPRQLVPRPRQSPHPPLWARCDRPAEIGSAARLGLGALCRSPLEPDEAAEWVSEYRSVLASERCVPVGLGIVPRVAICLALHVHEDEQIALDEGLDGAHFHAYAIAHYERFGEHVPGGTDLCAEFGARRDDVGLSRDAVVADGAPLSVRVLRGGKASLRGAIGTPAQVAELLARYAAAGVDDVLLLPSGGTPEQVEAALRLLAAQVLPALAGQGDVLDAGHPAPSAPAASLATAVREALERRPPPPPLVPGAIGALDEAPASAAANPGPATPGPALVEAPDGAGVPSSATLVGGMPVRFKERLSDRGTAAVRGAVRRADDRWLERTLGSERGLRVIFSAMRARFDPAAADGFVGAIAYELRDASGAVRTWGVRVTPTSAAVLPGPVAEAALTVQLGLADFLRLATGELDPGHLLLSGRMDLRGDFALATRLGAMFGM